jgi:hypothetical protein
METPKATNMIAHIHHRANRWLSSKSIFSSFIDKKWVIQQRAK